MNVLSVIKILKKYFVRIDVLKNALIMLMKYKFTILKICV